MSDKEPTTRPPILGQVPDREPPACGVLYYTGLAECTLPMGHRPPDHGQREGTMSEKTKTNAHVTLVVDRTGSMASICEEAEQGVNEYVKKQAELKGVDVTVSLYQFNITFDHVYGPVPAGEAPEYRLDPNNMTALYDAIGKGIWETRKMIDDLPEKPDKVALVIMTDGQENSSKEYNLGSVTQAINGAKDKGWEILFLSGDLTSTQFGHGTRMVTTGYDRSDPGATRSAYAAAASTTSAFFEGDDDDGDKA